MDITEDQKKTWEETSDFANYFCVYGYLYHQKQMLADEIRMNGYYNSIFKNKKQFEGKIVLDVGTGSGILSIWAAQAGASKVYAVEATDVVVHARKLIQAHNFDNVITVIQSKMEDVVLPEKVDIIISEWMGYFLLRESMLDSVLVARDKWLKPGGAMYPSHANMYLAPIVYEDECRKRERDLKDAMDGWAYFVKKTKAQFGVDMNCLSRSYQKEQEEYYKQTSIWVELNPNNLLSNPFTIKHIDIGTCSFESIKGVDSAFNMKITHSGRHCGFSGWFDVEFRGSKENPATENVTLSTSPATGFTHWGQQAFLIHPPEQVFEGDTIQGNVKIARRKDNQRLMNVQITHKPTSNDGTPGKESTHVFQIE